MDYEFTVTEV